MTYALGGSCMNTCLFGSLLWRRRAVTGPAVVVLVRGRRRRRSVTRTSVTSVTNVTRRGHGGHRGGHRLCGGRGHPFQVERLHARQVGCGRSGRRIWQCCAEKKTPLVTVLT